MDLNEIIKIITPLIVIEMALKLYCLFKLSKDEIKIFNKPIWIAIIMLFSTIGPLSYLIFGRVKE